MVAPKVTQSAFAAMGDWYTWRLAEKLYGQNSSAAWATVSLTNLVCRPIKKLKPDVASHHPPQSVAVVHFHKDILKLPRSNFNYSGALLLAVGIAWCR
jgi:hypothetical protein